MNKKLQEMLDASRDVHIPIPIDERETAEARLVQKEVLKSRVIDDMESLEHWELIKDYSIVGAGRISSRSVGSFLSASGSGRDME